MLELDPESGNSLVMQSVSRYNRDCYTMSHVPEIQVHRIHNPCYPKMRYQPLQRPPHKTGHKAFIQREHRAYKPNP